MTKRARFLPSVVRCFLILLCIMVLLGLLAVAGSIPFGYESQTIRYKLGFDKTLLRTGQVLGMAAATLLLLQLVLSARLKLLDHIFGLPRLYLFHRVNAPALGMLALAHPLFVFASEDIANLAVEMKYWPEILGGFLLAVIMLIIVSGLWRRFLEFSFTRWWLAHRLATSIAVVMLIVHVLYVSESFASGPPRQAVFLVGGVYLFLWSWVKVKPFILRRKTYLVSDISLVGRDAYKVTLTPPPQPRISYLPGQFVFLTFRSHNLSAEEHPFTICSTPTRPECLFFTIRCSGDWTSYIGRLRPGDAAAVDGPYGRFSHLVCDPGQELILIAGGIGITPMLSMLHYMADVRETRKVTLVWSNRTRDDIVFADELEELARRLPGLRIEHVFTREAGSKRTDRRLNQQKLALMLQDCSRRAAIFICGPPLMIKAMRRILFDLGFRRRQIYSEKFSL